MMAAKMETPLFLLGVKVALCSLGDGESKPLLSVEACMNRRNGSSDYG